MDDSAAVYQTQQQTMENNLPDYSSVVDAMQRIEARLHRTPVLTCKTLDQRLGAKLFFKAEHLQKTGSFKARGASNAVLSLNGSERQRGVVTHSSGNHAAALAWAAAGQGVDATVVMPENSLPNKIAAVRGYGAQVILCDGTLEARELALSQVIAESGAVFVPPYDDAAIISGQGTAALELFEQKKDLDVVVVPVGGGGLLAGTVLVAAEERVEVIGAEPALADDAYRSWKSGERQPAIDPPVTIADGLTTGLGERNWSIIRGSIARIMLAEEEQILEAAQDLMQFAKWVVEPSAAVPLAALMAAPDIIQGKNVGVILSGGNIDLTGMALP